jgi:beta-fructofuranosidase
MTVESAIEQRKRFIDDPHRPRYHFLPPSNWMNDPNGFIQWNGKYHLFYQYNPNGPFWADMHWGHAVSDDLMHWTDLPIALAPTPGGPDETGCFSGCAVDDNGVPTLIYTGVTGERHDTQTQCIATSHDGLLTWQKYAGNPVISSPPPESGQTRDFRDPFVWKEGGVWYMALGSRIQDIGGAIFLYRSQNLVDWEYLNPLLVGDINRNGVIWECPNFFKLGDRWVLIVSSHSGTATASVLYFVGTYENYRFTPSYEGVLDYGHLYAPLSTVDERNRRILIGWLREARPTGDQQRAGWTGVQSIPRVLGLDDHERLLMMPIPELEGIRGAHHHVSAADAVENLMIEVNGLALDIEVEFNPEAAGSCGLSLVYLPDDHERIDITYDAVNRHLVVRKVAAESNEATTTHLREVAHELAVGEFLKLRVLVDGSVIELIANDRTSLTSRVYPVHAKSIAVRLIGANACLHSLDIWEMPTL